MDRKPALILALTGILILVLLWAHWRESHPAWSRYQRALRPDRQPAVVEIRIPKWHVVDRCPTCHGGLEEIDSAHPVEAFGCTICHGGNGRALDAESAHRGMLGGANPARLDVVERTCGRRAPDGTSCHGASRDPNRNQVARVQRSLMATMTGVISSLRVTWKAQNTFAALYGSQAVHAPDGRVLLKPIPFFSKNQLPPHQKGARDRTGYPIDVSGQWADGHWRKLCARCHVWNRREKGPSVHGEGCSACHVEYAEDGRYHGGDITLKNAPPGRGAFHRMTAAVPLSRCVRCHNRSARIGLNYQGFMESDGYGAPFRKGGMNPHRLSGNRTVYHLVPDVHFEKGLHCIDCHTANDVMGDGRLYTRMREQVEISCTDCHGTYTTPPRLETVPDEAAYGAWASLYLNSPPNRPGTRIAATRRNHVLVNVRREGARLVLYSKVTGKRHPIPEIIGTSPVHAIQGHAPSRMECYACHTAWAPQCYGCHDHRRAGELQYDSQGHRPTPGRWVETRSHYRFARPSLGWNSRHKIAPFVPG